MATMKKLLGFRQLSLNCDTPQTPSKRRTLKKQFSEDRRDFKHWSDDLGIQIDLDDPSIRNPFVKHAWIDPADSINDEPVIIKKCGENRRATSGKLTRQGSLDNSKQDFQGRLRQNLKSTEEKPNLQIFLAQNSQDYPQEYISTVEKEEQPKIFKPLTVGVVNNDKSYFKIRKNTKAKINTPDTLWQVPNKKPVPELSEQPQDNVSDVGNYVKPIASVIIRPSTAASKREMFQKRTNSAFTTTVTTKEPQKPRRPLIRSSSAPCKPEHLKSKLIFQKHRKTFKKIQLKTATKTYDIDKNEENSKCQNGTTLQGSDVVTMVSLVSPAGSDGEEEEEEEEEEDIKMKTKNVYIEKSTPEPKPTPKIMTLRKAVKTVSFQQSSIHAIRSFSASFPARRSSVSAAMMMNNSLNSSSKVQEKRSTNSTKPDDDERMPKRRLVRNNKEDGKTASFDRVDNAENVQKDNQTTSNETTTLTTATKPEDNQNQHNLEMEKKSDDVEASSKESELDNLDLKSPKEKQCWNMYCKMTEKGINVSFDTILRGMLTPTEYRLSKKHSLIPPPNPEPPKST